MPKRKHEFAVIGLGRFGASAARALVEDGHHVLGIDTDRDLVQEYANQLTQTMLIDATSEDALRELEIESYDAVIVAIGQNFESNVLITASLKQLGARNVICKALTARQSDILHRIGADRVVLPEIEAGLMLAKELSRPRLLDVMHKIPGYSVAELRVPRRLAGKTLAEIQMNEKLGLMVLAVRSGEEMHIAPSGQFALSAGDVLVTLGTEEAVESFSRDQ